MPTAADILKQSYAYLGKPSQLKLPYQSIIDSLNRKVNGRLLDMQLSSNNWRAKLSSVKTFNSQDVALNLDSYSIPVRVESRAIGSDGEWEEEEIVDYAGWNSTNRPAVAFYGTPTRMVLNSDVNTREFRILYETGDVTINSLTQDIELAGIFVPLLFDEVTLDCLAMVNDTTPEWAARAQRLERILTIDLVKQDERFKKWVNISRNQGVIYKEAFNEGRTYGSTDWPRSD